MRYVDGWNFHMRETTMRLKSVIVVATATTMAEQQLLRAASRLTIIESGLPLTEPSDRNCTTDNASCASTAIFGFTGKRCGC